VIRSKSWKLTYVFRDWRSLGSYTGTESIQNRLKREGEREREFVFIYRKFGGC